MAEKNEETAVEEERIVTCSPCWLDGTREQAVQYCPVCQEYLCTTCIKYHRKMTATREHRLFDLQTKKPELCPDTKEKVKCPFHPERDVEMYCRAHDMVFCMKCIANDHRLCNGVSSTEDIPVTHVQFEMQTVEEKLNSFKERLEAGTERRQKNIQAVQMQKDKISQTILKYERNMIQHIGNLRAQAMHSLDKHCLEVEEGLGLDMAIMNSIKDELATFTRRLETAESMDSDQQFAVTKLLQKYVLEAKNLCEISVSNCAKSVYFTENTDLQSYVMKSNALGQMHIIAENIVQYSPRKYKVKRKIWVEVKLTTDKSKCIISDICQLQDGKIILTDQSNKKVKMLDHNYKIQDQCELDAIPTGICCTGKNEVCVKLNNNKLQFISVNALLIKQRELKIKDGSYYGISFFGGELWLSRRNGVSVYNTSGTLIKSVEADKEGTRVFKTDTVQHIAVRGDCVIVTDNADGAICLGRDGTVMRQFRDRRLQEARGVCVSNDGMVLISGSRSDNIMMFDGDGECLGQLVSKDAALNSPVSLCFDRQKNAVIVSCNSTSCIYIFELED